MKIPQLGTLVLILFFELISCSDPESIAVTYRDPGGIELVILGTIQDAGSPQIGCMKKCCANLYTTPDETRKVVSLGIIDRDKDKMWMIEATPDFTSQVTMLNIHADIESNRLPDGIFLTHGHIGHYTGLMYLGKEAMSSSQTQVYAMPRMKSFLENNGPWSQLVSDSNILILPLKDGEPIQLTENATITPFSVPHRDEFTETVGYRIDGPTKSALFIPDIDKWSKWSSSIIEKINEVDYALLDATFYNGVELGNRDMNDIPHPFIVESMELLKDLSDQEKAKVHFIHFNHTNPIIDRNSLEYIGVIKEGFKVAEFEQTFNL